MNQSNNEKIFEVSPLGITLSFCTTPGGYHPPHWHEEIELLYPLNGETDIIIENINYKLLKKNITVVESCKIHSTYAHDDSVMFLRILVQKERLAHYIPDITLCYIHCIPENIKPEQFLEYYNICKLLTKLTYLYMQDAPSFYLEAEGFILQAIARLIRFFSIRETLKNATADSLSITRIRSVIRYVEQHFRENISLQDASAHIGISREYFCRIFKKNIGISFLQYLNDYRLAKSYNDLQSTSLSVSEIIEQNGFTSQKQFNQSFKKKYGCTPSSVRSI